MVVRLNQVKSFHQGLNIMYLETFDIFQFSLFLTDLTLFIFPNSELREDNCPPSTYLVEGVKALISALRTWLKREVRVLKVTSTVQMVIVTRSETSPLFVLICWMCVSDQQQTSFCSHCALLLFLR